MCYAVYTTEKSVGVRRILSVHKNYELADKAWVKYYNAIPQWAFGIARCPKNKRRGSTLSFEEIMASFD